MNVRDTLHHEAKVEALVCNHKYIISGGTDNTIKARGQLNYKSIFASLSVPRLSL